MDVIIEYETSTGGHVGLHAENLRTGWKLTSRSDERFVMCSTVKASIAACILSQVDRGTIRLDDPIRFGANDVEGWYAPVATENLGRGMLSIREMCKAAVEESDNVCANFLLTRLGGPAAMTAYWRSLGDRVSRLDDPEPILNRTPPGDVRNTTTPAAMAATLRRMVLGSALSPASRTDLRTWMIGCKTGAHRLRAGIPSSWRIADKTGNNGKDGAGDIGVVWPKPDVPIVIVAYTRGGTPTEQHFQKLFAGIGQEMAAKLA
ncbi:class A beta-lactamase [Roseomonas sp. TAS13]|uniref:class A beta-lactamase n=1 Tax=Roseomonas sp. TAS13 TaxID=1926319 RepID=UPI00209A8790|nr:class A beta-lactamase [Roseomonas sp. TAS13]